MTRRPQGDLDLGPIKAKAKYIYDEDVRALVEEVLDLKAWLRPQDEAQRERDAALRSAEHAQQQFDQSMAEIGRLHARIRQLEEQLDDPAYLAAKLLEIVGLVPRDD